MVSKGHHLYRKFQKEAFLRSQSPLSKGFFGHITYDTICKENREKGPTTT